MDLSEYLFRNKISKTDFAALLGISRKTLYLILEGQEPRISVAMKIEEHTKKQVKFNDLIGKKIKKKKSKK